MNIVVAGIGYVGLSLAVLISQHNKVIAVDISTEKVDKLNHRISPIQDDYIEKYLSEKQLDLIATTDGEQHIEKQIMLLLLHRQIMIVRRITLIHLQWKK